MEGENRAGTRRDLNIVDDCALPYVAGFAARIGGSGYQADLEDVEELRQ